MSRIGIQPITLPKEVLATVANRMVTIAGPKGELKLSLHPHVRVSQEGSTLTVTVSQPDTKSDRALWGLNRVLLANMVIGVTKGFEKKLEINGVGFKAAVQGQTLTLALGFSHPVELSIPADITVTVEKNVVTVSGIDKQLVGETTAKIRRLKPPEPYKGKGIKYLDETIRRKAGKVVKAAGAK